MEDLINLSIRSRVAYAICCLEIVVKNKKVSENPHWMIFMEKLWSLTNMEYVDDWLHLISEILPSNALNDEYSEDFEISRKIFYDNKVAFRLLSLTEIKICDLIFEIGTVDLYGAIQDKSPLSLIPLNEVINILNEQEYDLPKIERFLPFSIFEGNGWGKTFERNDVVTE